MDKKIVPLKKLYDLIEKYNRSADCLLYISTALSVAISIFSRYGYLGQFKISLSIINCILISFFFFFDQRASYVFTKTEMKRRLDWLDNSFDTNFSGKKSKNYFTNQHLSPGLYKLAANCFENSHHTQFIISKMLSKSILKAAIVIFAILISGYLGDREIFRLIFEMALPTTMILKLIKVVFYSTRMAEVYDRFKLLFNDLLDNDFANKTPEAIRDVIEYETTISWASIPLESKIFYKNMDLLAKEWEELKIAYKII